MCVCVYVCLSMWCEYSNDNCFSEPVAWLYGGEQVECYIAS